MHCDTPAFAVETAKALAEGLPNPPQALDDHAAKFWPSIVGSKRPTAWTESDLHLACQIARDLAAIEQLTEELQRDGRTLEDPKGKKYAHPAANMLDQAVRRAAATARAVQIHAIATTGKSDHQGKKNEAARDLAAKMASADSDLIPRAKH